MKYNGTPKTVQKRELKRDEVQRGVKSKICTNPIVGDVFAQPYVKKLLAKMKTMTVEEINDIEEINIHTDKSFV